MYEGCKSTQATIILKTVKVLLKRHSMNFNQQVVDVLISARWAVKMGVNMMEQISGAFSIRKFKGLEYSEK